MLNFVIYNRQRNAWLHRATRRGARTLVYWTVDAGRAARFKSKTSLGYARNLIIDSEYANEIPSMAIQKVVLKIEVKAEQDVIHQVKGEKRKKLLGKLDPRDIVRLKDRGII